MTYLMLMIVLGINGHRGASRLVRALLADPLAPEAQWEKQLIAAGDEDGRALVLRYVFQLSTTRTMLIPNSYGEEPDFDQRNPLVKTLSVPSQMLLALNLEILVRENSPISQLSNTDDYSFLIPGLEAPNSNGGPTSAILYPVHKALVYAEGLEYVSSLFTAEPQSAHIPSGVVRAVVDATWNNLNSEPGSEKLLCPINLTHAESAIDSFRKSVEMAVEYEHSWFDSGLANLSTWLVEGLDMQASTLKPTLRRLIETMSNNAEQAILEEEEVKTRLLSSNVLSASTAEKNLLKGLKMWVEVAHKELRGQLDYAFSSRTWRKLAWWKLLWRVDDVGFITTDVLQRAWLVEAEKEMIWLSGRVIQSTAEGLWPFRSAPKSKRPKPSWGQFPSHVISDLANEVWQAQHPNVNFLETVSRPWPQKISRARSSLSRATIAPLQALSQSLLFQTVSTTALTSSLSALIYVSVSTTSVYEAGAIAAIGFALSMRRLQKKWSLAIEAWEETVRETGRRVLRDAEEEMKAIIRETGKGSLDEKEVEARRVAREAVGRVRKALEELD